MRRDGLGKDNAVAGKVPVDDRGAGAVTVGVAASGRHLGLGAKRTPRISVHFCVGPPSLGEQPQPRDDPASRWQCTQNLKGWQACRFVFLPSSIPVVLPSNPIHLAAVFTDLLF